MNFTDTRDQITPLPLIHRAPKARTFGSDDSISFQCPPALSAHASCLLNLYGLFYPPIHGGHTIAIERERGTGKALKPHFTSEKKQSCLAPRLCRQTLAASLGLLDTRRGRAACRGSQASFYYFLPVEQEISVTTAGECVPMPEQGLHQLTLSSPERQQRERTRRKALGNLGWLFKEDWPAEGAAFGDVEPGQGGQMCETISPNHAPPPHEVPGGP
ncbi:hypothetical protein L3Q82_014765 [Scortum barcoo]|uniref:Uncharacterized protein n=1 Tax=Scortum barcoo TaxID=214431 RepID=A0ACB8VRZ1_9TELE|nr:hypothetical protein L3Q82_014765 [Scortum barcoo]